MGFIVTLYSHLPAELRPPGIPLECPGRTKEVPDGTKPGAGELYFATAKDVNAFCAEGPHKDAYAAWEADNRLPQDKRAKCAEIDERTVQHIAEGFVFNDMRFSLSQNSQLQLLGLGAFARAKAISYPVRYNTLDDKNVFELDDADTVEEFVATAIGTYRRWLDSGTALKDLVRKAETKDELDAIEDAR